VTDADARARTRVRRARWIALLVGALLRVVARTWRVREIHLGGGDIVRQHERPAVFCLWHCELLCHLWTFRGQGIVVLISEHGDGEIVARVAEGIGYRTIRGSSRRGAERALLALAREAERGASVAVTPDGPRGPAESFAPGALIAAQRAGAPIVLMRAVVNRAWRLRSWDRFIIPKPFARITIVVSAPIAVNAATAREAADQAPRFQALLRELPETTRG